MPAPKTALLCALTAALGLFSGPDAEADHHAITPQTLSTRIAADDPPYVLDVRTANEYAEGHVPGAVNIPYDQLAARLGELPVVSDEILLYCRSGRRAELAEDTLRANGYENLRQLSGHWLQWSKQ